MKIPFSEIDAHLVLHYCISGQAWKFVTSGIALREANLAYRQCG
jgi:hypothetical protein